MGPRFALISFIWSSKVRLLAIPEDAIPAAEARGWLVLGRDSDVLTPEAIEPAQSNPQREQFPDRESD